MNIKFDKSYGRSLSSISYLKLLIILNVLLQYCYFSKHIIMIYYEKRSRKRILNLNIRTEFEIEQTDRNHFFDTELPEERSTDLSHGMHS